MSLSIIRVIGIIIYLYLVWRNMKEEYGDEKMISFAWLSFLWFLVGGRGLFGLINWGIFGDSWFNWFLFWTHPGFSYFGGFWGIFFFIWWYSQKNGIKLFSILEDLVNNFLWLLFFLLLNDFIFMRDIYLLGAIFGVLLAILMAKYFKLKYRSWSFYKSGKKGFVFLSMAFILFLSLSIFSLFLGNFWIHGFLYLISSLIFVTQLVILGEICQKK